MKLFVTLLHLVPILAQTVSASQQIPIIINEQEQKVTTTSPSSDKAANTSPSSRNWEQSVAYGARILAAVNAKTDEAATAAWGAPIASNFTSVDDLETYGWVRDPDWSISLISRARASAVDAFRAMGASEFRNVLVQHDNSARVTIQGQTYEPTSAKIKTVINVPAGLLIADDNLTPGKATGARPPITPLRFWSDVAFLQWLRAAGSSTSSVTSLRYILQSLITNKQTRAQIQAALLRTGHTTLPTWRRAATFRMDDDDEKEAALALLGSQNGAGCGLMLAGRKAQLGPKRIVRVTVWGEQEWDLRGDINKAAVGVFMLFEISDQD